MTDEDIIRRLHAVTGVGSFGVNKQQADYKIVYRWTVAAKLEREWITRLLYPWMGTRRQARIRELLADVA